MGILTDDMKRFVREVRLGFHATVSEDGSPNLSPKGTTAVWDDDHLFFAEIRSPQTVANVRRGSLVEVNVVDPFVRKGYRFKGPAVVHERGTDEFAAGMGAHALGRTRHRRGEHQDDRGDRGAASPAAGVTCLRRRHQGRSRHHAILARTLRAPASVARAK
jgi:hypothetical protein